MGAKVGRVSATPVLLKAIPSTLAPAPSGSHQPQNIQISKELPLSTIWTPHRPWRIQFVPTAPLDLPRSTRRQLSSTTLQSIAKLITTWETP